MLRGRSACWALPLTGSIASFRNMDINVKCPPSAANFDAPGEVISPRRRLALSLMIDII